MTMFGVYWEYNYSHDDTVASFLFVPEHMRGSKSEPPTLLYRTVSSETPQKAYRFHKGTASNAALVGTSGDPTTLATQMMPQLSIFSEAVIQSMEGNPNFEMSSFDPIYIEISEQERSSIYEEATPRSLTARLYRARTAAGYPALPGKETS